MAKPRLRLVKPAKRRRAPRRTARSERIRRPIEITLSDEALHKLGRLAREPRAEGNRSRVIERLILAAEEAPRPRRRARSADA